MNKPLRIRVLAIFAVSSLVVLASSAAAGHLPRPLGVGNQPLKPGVQVLDLVSREHGHGGPVDLPRIAVSVPKGWFNYDGWGMNDGGTLIVSFWDVNKVYPTGCHWASKPMIDPGPTVNGLARALATRPLRHASKPRPVTLDGFHGKYLKWSVPRDLDLAECRQGYFESWTAKGWASDRYQQGPGQVDRLWILDVDGRRLAIDAAYEPWATRRQRTQLGRIVHSIKFLHARARALSTLTGKTPRPTARNGRWIAYSTAPVCAADQVCSGGEQSSAGSDVYTTRAGGRPKLVDGRGRSHAWNICPAFSPNGRMLAFARETGRRSTLVVVRIGTDGPIAAGRRVLKVPAGAHCPEWSANSSRLAYLDGGSVTILGLNGKRLRRANGDPTRRDFARPAGSGIHDAIVSPTAKLIAWHRGGSTVVSRPDGSHLRVIPEGGDEPGEPSYGIAGWSPDGRKLLLMYDVGGFQLSAASVTSPFASETIVDNVPVDNPRLWPGYGDVSWQPIPRRRSADSRTTAAQVASVKTGAHVKLSLLPLPSSSLGAAANSLPLEQDSGLVTNKGVIPLTPNRRYGLARDARLGRLAGYVLDYGDATSGSAGVTEVWTSVDEYKTSADAKKDIASWPRWDQQLNSGFQNAFSVVFKNAKTAPIGTSRFAVSAGYSAANIARLFGFDEQFTEGRYEADVTVWAGSAAVASKLAPRLARKLDARLERALAGRLHATPVRLPTIRKPGAPPGGPDLASLALKPTDVVGRATAGLDSYLNYPFARSAYAAQLSPAGQYPSIYQEMQWYPTRNEASFEADLWAMDFDQHPLDLSSVGHGAKGFLWNTSQGPTHTGLIDFDSGHLHEFVDIDSAGTLQASQVESIAETLANYIDEAKLGPALLRNPPGTAG